MSLGNDSSQHLPSSFVDCGSPNTPNGKLTAESTTVFDGTAVVECNEGYEGGGVATCLDDATWDTLPPCTPVGKFKGLDRMPSGKDLTTVPV